LIEVADERAQASLIAQQILNARAQGTALKEEAVLFRDGRHSAQLEFELTPQGTISKVWWPKVPGSRAD
jgi:DNA helicase II / ATP-dependent DNA helicase PcrA